MYFIVYTSEYTGTREDIHSVVDNIVARSKVNNPRFGITGLLFYHHGRFIQVLEGEQHSLEGLMTILGKDSRHQNIQRIIDQSIKKRGFQEWNMDSLDLSEEQDIDPVELIRIRDAYKKHLLIDSKYLVDFYKAMLKLNAPESSEKRLS